MFHVLMLNPDPMGGGAAYSYVTNFRTKLIAQSYIADMCRKYRGSQGWEPNYIITQEVG